MKKIILIILTTILSYQAGAQGFDWQYSSRLPVDYPNLYAGINFNYSFFYHRVEFAFIQQATECCKFGDGEGNYPFAGVNLEYWLNSPTALKASLDYKVINSTFSVITSTPKPIGNEIKNWEQRYSSNINLHYLFLNLGAKYRILNTHFSIGGSAGIGILTSNNQTHQRESLTPEFYYRSPGNYVQTIDVGTVPAPKSALFYPGIELAYDLSLGKGTYASPSVKAMIPIYNLLNSPTDEWYPWSVSFGITILRGFKVAGL